MTGRRTSSNSVEYIASRVWADDEGRNQAGAVLIQEQRVFAARDVQKGDARPGGYVATGGHGGILGAAGHDGPPLLTICRPRATPSGPRSTSRAAVAGHWACAAKARARNRSASRSRTRTGDLLDTAIPKVSIVKDASYWADDNAVGSRAEVDLLALIEHMLRSRRSPASSSRGFRPTARPPRRRGTG